MKVETDIKQDEKRCIFRPLMYSCLPTTYRGVHGDSPILFAVFCRALLRQSIENNNV
jgi:hypothetical protein